MNWRRGLIRLWIVGSIAWVLFTVWSGDLSCFVGSYPWCAWWIVSPWWQSTYLAALAKVFGTPILVLSLGAAISWVVGGFHDGGKSKPKP